MQLFKVISLTISFLFVNLASAACTDMFSSSTGMETHSTDTTSTETSDVVALDIGAFKYRTSGLDLGVEKDMVIAESIYNNIKVAPGVNLTFAAQKDKTEYILSRLYIYNDINLNLAPGDYWVDELYIGEGVTLTVTGTSGVVRLFTNKSLSISKNSKINELTSLKTSASTAGRLFLYSGGDLIIGEGGLVQGYLYVKNRFVLSKTAKLIGSVVAAEFDVVKQNDITYDAGSLTALDLGDLDPLCSNMGSGSVTNFRLSHETVGSLCSPLNRP